MRSQSRRRKRLCEGALVHRVASSVDGECVKSRAEGLGDAVRRRWFGWHWRRYSMMHALGVEVSDVQVEEEIEEMSRQESDKCVCAVDLQDEVKSEEKHVRRLRDDDDQRSRRG
mmetsp:Transcript_116960/g.376210  ORF Transcript_116960/g.376210 Transcript_116960/m.376210 type:complete len:114 (+) Transcript_116960:751-1092(+)